MGVGFGIPGTLRSSLPVVALFVMLPYVRAGTPGHAALACAALVFYTIAFLFAV